MIPAGALCPWQQHLLFMSRSWMSSMEKHSRWPKQIFNNAIKNQVGGAANSELLSIRSSIIRGQKAAPPPDFFLATPSMLTFGY